MPVVLLSGKILLRTGKIAISPSCCCGEQKGSPCCPAGVIPPNTLWAHLENVCGRYHWPITRQPGVEGCPSMWHGTTDSVRCRQDAFTPCGSEGQYRWGIRICEGIPCTISVECCKIGVTCDNQGQPNAFYTVSLPLLDPKCKPFDTGDITTVGGEGNVGCAQCRVNPGAMIRVRVNESPNDPWA